MRSEAIVTLYSSFMIIDIICLYFYVQFKNKKEWIGCAKIHLRVAVEKLLVEISK